MRKRSIIGKRFILWRIVMQTQRYKDQYDIQQEREYFIVCEEVEVKIISSISTSKDDPLWKAESANLEIFTLGYAPLVSGRFPPNHWKKLPAEDHKREKWIDGIDAHNRRGRSNRYERPDGEVAVPVRTYECQTHRLLWLPEEKHGCTLCYLQSKNNGRSA